MNLVRVLRCCGVPLLRCWVLQCWRTGFPGSNNEVLANRLSLEQLRAAFLEVLEPWAKKHGFEIAWAGPGYAGADIGLSRGDLIITFSVERYEAQVFVGFHLISGEVPDDPQVRWQWLSGQPAIRLHELRTHRSFLGGLKLLFQGFRTLRTVDDVRQLALATVNEIESDASDLLEGKYESIPWHERA